MATERTGGHDPTAQSVNVWLGATTEPRIRPGALPPSDAPPVRHADVSLAVPAEGFADTDAPLATGVDSTSRSMLAASLDALVRLIEKVSPGMRGSVLLLDGSTLDHGAAPHLPEAYCTAIDGVSIGPSAGSCGTAAFRRERVIVRDIATDPLWADYRTLAETYGLAACWSTPILDRDGAVLGTFAMYYDEPREPTSAELELADTAAALAGNAIKRDVAERALHSRIKAAEELVAVRDAALAEARRANKAKTDFLAMMSHELRTPLNAIGGYAQLVLDGIPGPASEAHQNYMRRISRSQQHIVGLIEAVLTHAMVEAGKVTYRITDVTVREVLDIIEPLTAPQRATKRLGYDCDGCDAGLVFRGDREKVVQIMLNLLSNAAKFTPADGKITVVTERRDSGVIALSVRDTGIGMLAEQVERVFEPFVQFDSSLSREHRGAGLGVSISREFARGMGGELVAVSDLRIGSTFTLTLPVATAP